MKENIFPAIAAAVCLCTVLVIAAFVVFGGDNVYDFAKKEEPVVRDPLRTVYISGSGSTVYHEEGCSYLNSMDNGMTASAAEEAGYTPCSRCGK